MSQRSYSTGFMARRVEVLAWAIRAVGLAGAACLLAVMFIGCAGTRETEPLELESGPNAEISHDGLVRAHGSEFAGIWVKPDADISRYDQLLIGQVRMAYKRKPDSRRYSSTGNNFALTDSQVERMERLFRESLEGEIKDAESWTLAEEPGPNVLLVEPGLMDLVVTAPTQTASRDRVYTTSAGAVTLVLELRDSLSHEIVARLADRSQASTPGTGSNQLSWSNPVNNTAAVRSIFRRWSRIFMARLDTAARLHPSSPLADDEDATLGDANEGADASATGQTGGDASNSE